jgi:hypothetical protein
MLRSEEFPIRALLCRQMLKVMLYSSPSSPGIVECISIMDLNSKYQLTGISDGVVRNDTDDIIITISLELRSILTWYRFFSLNDVNLMSKNHLGHKPEAHATFSQMTADLVKHDCGETCGNLLYTFQCLHVPRKLSDIQSRFANFDLGGSMQKGNNTISCLPSFMDVASDIETFRLLSQSEKLNIIAEWEAEMSTVAIKPLACSTCGTSTSSNESQYVDARSVDLTLLRNDDLPNLLFPKDYDFEMYGRALLCQEGLEDGFLLKKMRICNRCWGALTSSRMPKFALANWLYYGCSALPFDVKEAFVQSSLFERMLVARARCNSICCRFKDGNVYKENTENTAADVLANARRGIRGNVMVSPLDTVKMNNVVPPNSAGMKDTMCAVFIGSKLPTKSNIHRFKPVLVRRTRVKTMIEFLLNSNPHYKPTADFGFSRENLDALLDEEEEGVPGSVDIGLLSENEALKFSTSDYTERNVDGEVDSDCDEVLMENVGYTEGDNTPDNYRAMKTAALQRCLSGKPFVASGKGRMPVPDFNNPSILTWLFPHLDPWGIGGFHEGKRKISISMEEQLSHLLRLFRSPFQTDPEFAFVFFNVVRKARVARTMRFSVPHESQRSVITRLLRVKASVVENLNRQCQKDAMYKPNSADEKEAFEALSALSMVARHVPGSDGYKVSMRNEIRGLINYEGCPSIFLTINPSDVENPIVRLFSGEEIDLEKACQGDDLGEWRRKLLAARNPAACAKFFDLMITKFIKIILRYGRGESGVFGKCKAYYGTVEAQGKGTLHCHMLIWLEGHPSPQVLHQKLASSEIFRSTYVSWLESNVRCGFPLQVIESTDGTCYSERIRSKSSGYPHRE